MNNNSLSTVWEINPYDDSSTGGTSTTYVFEEVHEHEYNWGEVVRLNAKYKKIDFVPKLSVILWCACGDVISKILGNGSE